jgi:tRNA pseudouridine55 synthase
MKGSNNRHQGENISLSDGIILSDKAEGETSFDVVRRFKRILNLKKIGHAGTLDPFATGLLIILIGQGTKLSPYLMAGRKKYLATIEMGVETDTLDPTGRVVRELPVPELEWKEASENIKEFIGEIEQVPPIFSAVNYNGERAYKLARRGVDVKLKKRKVTIYSIEINDIELPYIILEICCSGGTYIRSLASEIGLKLGTVAHLKKLRRISSGPFCVDGAVRSKDVEPSIENEIFFNSYIPLLEALPDMEESRLERSTATKVRNGLVPDWKELRINATFPDVYEGSIKLIDESSLVAIMEVSHLSENKKDWLKKIRVFN